jgi:predicted acetyltransferase
MSTSVTEVELQPAGEADIPAMAALWAEAFPEKPAERRAREIREGFVYGDLTDCWIVQVDGRLAGALRTYRLTMHLWGRPMPTMGLAGVAVAPDFRRRGIGRRMCVKALNIARDRGDVFCALYPFKTSFYRDLGFALAGEVHRYSFNPYDFPIYPGWDRVQRAPQEGHELAREIYDRVAPRTNGLLERTDRMFAFLRRPGTYLYVHQNLRGKATGYIVVRGRGGPPEKSRLRVLELVAEDREAYLALLGWLSVQRDQWGRIVYDACPGEDFHHRIAHPRTEGSGNPRGLWFHSAHILRGPMIRILNLEKLMAADEGAPRVAPRAGISRPDGMLQIRDQDMKQNQGSWKDGDQVADTMDPQTGPVLTIGEVASQYLRGTLPGQPLPAADWHPNLNLPDLRILDEF